MNTLQKSAAIIVLLVVGIAIGWNRIGRDGVPPETAPGADVKLMGSKTRTKQNLDLAAAFVTDPNSLSDEDYQQAARDYEEQKRAQRAAAKRPVGHADRDLPYRRWRQRVEKIQAALDACEEFPEGSVQWHMREELKQLLQEQPRQP